MKCADFDGVMFYVFFLQGKKNELNVLISTKCVEVLNKHGVVAKLKQVYGNYLVETESGYDYTLCVDTNALPASDEEKDKLARSFSFIKRHLFAAPFDTVFNAIDANNIPKDILDIPYRGSERVFIKPEGKDRLTVVVGVNFKDQDDIIIGKVFLQEFQKSIGGAPSVTFTQKEPPGEIRALKNLSADGYVTFVLFDRHFKKESRDKTIDMILQFRNYLHYHIKCSKSHLHTRMRNRVDSLLKVLNRAKQDLPKEKTTAGGRTFKKTPAK